MTRTYASYRDTKTADTPRVRRAERPQGRYKMFIEFLGRGRAPESPQAAAMAAFLR